MLSSAPQNSTAWYSWSLNSDNPTAGAKYIKEGVSPEAAESNSFSHRLGVFLIRCLFLASSIVYWYARETKPSNSAKDLIIGIFMALSLMATTAHMVLSSKESTLRLLMYCNVSNNSCQIIVLVCLFYGVQQSQVSPLNLAMLTALMVGETSNSRSILAAVIVGTLLLAIDPNYQTDYSSVVLAIAGPFVIIIFVSYQLWYHAPESSLAELYAPKKQTSAAGANAIYSVGVPAGGSNPTTPVSLNRLKTEIKGSNGTSTSDPSNQNGASSEDNTGTSRVERALGQKKLSGFWTKAFGTDRHGSQRDSIPPQDNLPNKIEYTDLVDRDQKGRLWLLNR
jgi:hypothetical protein